MSDSSSTLKVAGPAERLARFGRTFGKRTPQVAALSGELETSGLRGCCWKVQLMLRMLLLLMMLWWCS